MVDTMHALPVGTFIFACIWCACPAHAQAPGTHLSADLELDFDLLEQDGARHEQGGRARLVLQSEHRRGDFFLLGRGEALLRRSGETARDDAFLRFGTHRWDLQFGRFEAWDLGPKGKDTVVNHVHGIHYFGQAARGRGEHGQIALRVYPSDRIGFELAALFEAGQRPGATRASVRLQREHATLVAGIERDSVNRRYGVALHGGVLSDRHALNLNLGYRRGGTSGPVVTLGINFVRGRFGIGALHSRLDDDVRGGSETTLYAGYTFARPLFGNGTITLGVSHSLASGALGDAAADKTTLRMRFAIPF